eukprot:3954929-Amphidinium_carterae.1
MKSRKQLLQRTRTNHYHSLLVFESAKRVGEVPVKILIVLASWREGQLDMDLAFQVNTFRTLAQSCAIFIPFRRECSKKMEWCNSGAQQGMMKRHLGLEVPELLLIPLDPDSMQHPI